MKIKSKIGEEILGHLRLYKDLGVRYANPALAPLSGRDGGTRGGSAGADNYALLRPFLNQYVCIDDDELPGFALALIESAQHNGSRVRNLLPCALQYLLPY